MTKETKKVVEQLRSYINGAITAAYHNATPDYEEDRDLDYTRGLLDGYEDAKIEVINVVGDILSRAGNDIDFDDVKDEYKDYARSVVNKIDRSVCKLVTMKRKKK